MSAELSSVPSTRVVRPRLFWRIMFAQVFVLAAFLYFSLLCLGGYLLMIGFDAQHTVQQRGLAIAAGGGVVLACLWLFRVTMPRRLSPVVVERMT